MHKFTSIHNIDLSMYETSEYHGYKHIQDSTMCTKNKERSCQIHSIYYDTQLRKSIKKAGLTNQTCSVSDMQK